MTADEAPAHPACWDTERLLRACELRRQRRSGPGGQHRNKVETGIFLRHIPSGVEVSATERRGQEANRQVAVARLRLALAVHVRTPPAPRQVPSRLWQQRCQRGRVSVSVTHADYPALLAEALDMIVATDEQLSEASRRLNCTTSQLVKLIKLHPAAWTWLNERRRARGLGPLK